MQAIDVIGGRQLRFRGQPAVGILNQEGVLLQITKEMLGVKTRKKILYLDQLFWSLALREESKADEALRRIEKLLDLQLLAIPYSSIHQQETQLWAERGADLLAFIRTASRGHKFEPTYRVERTQILKAFQSFLDNASPAYLKEQHDALPGSVHEWGGAFSVSVDCTISAAEINRRRGFKQKAINKLEKTLPEWRTSKGTFEEDVKLELRDSARILTDHYAHKTARILAGDISALSDSPIDADIVGDMAYVLHFTPSVPLTKIGEFFNSEHFAGVPSQQLSARLFAAFKKRVREGMFPNPRKARDKYEGFLFDVEHVATYAPYCDAFFADRFMADVMNDKKVAVEPTFSCKAFSTAHWQQFFRWLDEIESGMTVEHADALGWAYPKYRVKNLSSQSGLAL